MKIAFVLDDSLDSTDGVQQYILGLGHWLKSKGHEVHYIVGETKRTDTDHVHSLSKNIKVRFNKNKMSMPLPVASATISKHLENQKYDILHIQMPFSPLFGGRVIKEAHKLGIPTIATFHILPARTIEKVATRLLALVQKRSVALLAEIVSVSEPAKEFVDDYFKVQSNVIPNPVNMESLKNDSKRKSSKQIRILFIGRLVSRKGCRELLKAFSLLDIDKQELQLDICGDGSLRGELEAFVINNKLQESVTFHGYVDEIEKTAMLHEADIAVFPSTGGESFGIVLIEAMAGGVPVVIAGDNPGYRWVMNGREDQLVVPSDRKKFTATLKYYISNASARGKTQKWQLQHVKRFDVNVVGRQILDQYESVIAKHSQQYHNNL